MKETFGLSSARSETFADQGDQPVTLADGLGSPDPKPKTTEGLHRSVKAHFTSPKIKFLIVYLIGRHALIEERLPEGFHHGRRAAHIDILFG